MYDDLREHFLRKKEEDVNKYTFLYISCSFASFISMDVYTFP